MTRYRIAAALLVVMTGARAEAQDQSRPGNSATGTPSNANGSVSPSTVADAVMRPDRPDPDTPAFGISLGSSIAFGDFGTGQDSRILSTALGARYAVGNFRISASIPYLDVRSRGIIFSGIDSTPLIVAGARPGAPAVTNNGIGDLTLGGAYTSPQHGSVPEIELAGRVKLPTASDSSQLSTGKTDFSAGIQITRTYGKVAPFVAATYRVFGDPALIDLTDGFAASAGTSVGLGDRTVAIFSYHYAAAASRLVRDSHELFAGISAGLPHSKLRLTGFATVGLSNGAAAESGGLSLSLDL